MKCILIVVLALGTRIPASQGWKPVKQIVETSRAADAKEAQKTKNDQQAAQTDIQGILVQIARIQQQDAQELKDAENQKNRDVDISGKIKKYTFWLVIVGAVQALVLVGTVCAVLQQTLTARTIERAWITVSPVHRDPPLGFIPDASDPIGAEGRDWPNVFVAKFTNTGNTPATIHKTCTAYIAIDSFKSLPIEPQYPEAEIHEGLSLFRNEEPIARVAFLVPNRILTKEQVAAVRLREQLLYAFGFIDYRDVFGRQHTTRFGYVYNFPQGGEPQILTGFMPSGPDKYNKNT